jgi:hypothetical protein
VHNRIEDYAASIPKALRSRGKVRRRTRSGHRLLKSTPTPQFETAPTDTLHSLSHSGLFQAASAFRKTFNLKGRNLRFEYTAKTGICGEAHFGNSRMSAPLASASSQ